MDYQKYIGQIVIRNNEEGSIVSFNEERITVAFKDGNKMLNPKIAFTNRFIRFKDETFNKEMDEEFIEKEKQDIKSREEAHKKAIVRHKRVNQIYKKLEKKNKFLKQLFGRDFVYPPYEEFKKQYRLILDKEVDFFRSMNVNYKYWL